MSAAIVGMGMLTELVFRDRGHRTTLHPGGSWLAWSPERRALLICKPAAGTARPLTAAVRRIHRAFHAAPTTRSIVVDWPDQRGALQPLGRLVRLTYRVPKELRSPGKKRFWWRHSFGDHGESGHDVSTVEKQYPERYMPLLCRDLSGNLFIKRMRGNRYYVSEWLMW